MKKIFVTKKGDGANKEWRVVRPNAKRASRVFEKQEDAANYAGNIAEKEHLERKIQGKDHKFKYSESYGKESNKKDTEN